MSYRCHECRVVCDHGRISTVTETRARQYTNNRGDVSHGQEIVSEISLCRDCAGARAVNVAPAPEPVVPNGQGRA